ncbi:HAD-IA family hydrolase [Lentibacillus sp. N15]|uniref:HAD family hydrolase n=1 Tax=Lentibacillus songyuanensis TaxID=3136161 RepID=UPI0031BB69CA
MVQLNVDNQAYDIDGILFDKDGTLIDFGSLWVNWAEELITRVVSTVKLPEEYKNILSQSIGYDSNERDWDAKGPLAIGSMDDIVTILAYQLYAFGISWDQALELVTNVYIQTNRQTGWKEKIRPITGLQSFLDEAKACSIKLGVVTSDNQDRAIDHLKALKIDSYFASVIGHDQVTVGKPFPEMVEKACDQLNLTSDRAIIIGDSDGDMVLGKKSGTAASIGIVAEPSHSSSHFRHADHIIHSYHDLFIHTNAK